MSDDRERILPRSGAGRLRARVAEAADAPAIARFNERVTNGGESYVLPLDPRLPGEARPESKRPKVYRELLIVEDDDEIRAGLLQHHADLWVAPLQAPGSRLQAPGAERPFCWVYLPVSEGRIDRRFALSIVLLMRYALSRQPFQMSLGIGSLDAPWAQFLKKLAWRHATVPFFFYPVRPGVVIRSLPQLRRTSWLRVGSQALAWSGMADLMGLGLAARRQIIVRVPAYKRWEQARFGDWADRLFEEARGAYGAAVKRDAATLNTLYPPEDRRFTRLLIRRHDTGRDVGWIVVAERQMQANPHLGDLHVGTLIDGFGHPEEVLTLLDAGTRYLANRGVDLIVANWSHHAWVRASRTLGFLSGPSNYFLFVSPEAPSLLTPSLPLSEIHLGRGDGEGPGTLLPSPTRGQRG